jgi:hypothetical protein
LRVFLPALKSFELCLPHTELPNARRQPTLTLFVGLLAFGLILVLFLEFVGCADLDLVKLIEQVEMGDEERVDCVEPFGVLNQI